MATEALKNELRRWTSPCVNSKEFPVSVDGALFNEDDVAALQDAYFNGDRTDKVHLDTTPGWICLYDLNLVGNRKMADRLYRDCSNILPGEAGEKKCDALIGAYELRAAEPSLFSAAGLRYYGKEALKWGSLTIISGYMIGLGFAHVSHLFAKGGGPKGPQGPSGGTNAGGGGGASGADGASGGGAMQRSMAEKVAAGAALVGLSLAIAWLVANDATGVGVADDALLVPATAGWMRAAAVFGL